MYKTSPSVSVIVTTYNWPQALDLVLAGLMQQCQQSFEILVADDGSTQQTADVIEKYTNNPTIKVKHIWQQDLGFRAAKIRNKAVLAASGEYLIFIDGDCVPASTFVKNHLKLAKLGWFVAGNRVLLAKQFSEQVLSNNINLNKLMYLDWGKLYLQRSCNRIMPLLNFPLGMLRKCMPNKWQGVKTCNLSLFKQDFIAVNGLDESFVGWGFEDSDLIIRLQRYGIKRISGKFKTPVFHLWHQEQSRENLAKNRKQLDITINSTNIVAKQGIAQHHEV